ncbi:MAG TPA: hypothetical protein ENF47_03005 [Thermoprotei archaeon]|nr:hypothetical protein [Thermoprotei archaeon]
MVRVDIPIEGLKYLSTAVKVLDSFSNYITISRSYLMVSQIDGSHTKAIHLVIPTGSGRSRSKTYEYDAYQLQRAIDNILSNCKNGTFIETDKEDDREVMIIGGYDGDVLITMEVDISESDYKGMRLDRIKPRYYIRLEPKKLVSIFKPFTRQERFSELHIIRERGKLYIETYDDYIIGNRTRVYIPSEVKYNIPMGTYRFRIVLAKDLITLSKLSGVEEVIIRLDLNYPLKAIFNNKHGFTLEYYLAPKSI